MRTIQLTCSRCNATLFLEKERGYSKLSCPYCGGSMKLLMDIVPSPNRSKKYKKFVSYDILQVIRRFTKSQDNLDLLSTPASDLRCFPMRIFCIIPFGTINMPGEEESFPDH